jgi:DnaD/phage-associated family protein
VSEDHFATFDGFQDGPANITVLPAAFFSELLPLVDDLLELKVILIAYWALQQKESALSYVLESEFQQHITHVTVGEQESQPAAQQTHAALERAVKRGALLRTQVETAGEIYSLYFANTPRGRVARDQVESGAWKADEIRHRIEILPERPNIYRLYEQNIGPLTPMIAESLKEAAREYPAQWIVEAIGIAVEANKRSWRYIEKILDRWQHEGKQDIQGEKPGEAPQSIFEEDGRRYIPDEYADFFE